MTTRGQAFDLHLPVTRHILGNGLRVVLSRDHAAPTICVAVYYNVGMRLEPKGRTGFAHLFEHLMFQGSESLGKMELARLVQENGGNLNGSTRYDYTNYFEALPAHTLDLALWMEADRMRGPVITQAELDNQRDVVKNEIRVNVLNRPYGSFPWIDMQAVAFDNWHNSHNGYGDMADLDAASLGDVQAFFASYYSPANAVLVIVGDFQEERALELVRRYFEDIPAAEPPPRADISEPRQEAERRSSHIDALANKPALAVGYRVPERGSREFYALGLLDQVLLQGEDALLHQELVSRRGFTASVDGGINFLGHMHNGQTPLLWTSELIHDRDVTADAILEAFDEVIERVRAEPLAQAVLDRALVKARASLYTTINDTYYPGFGRADLLGAFELFEGDAAQVNTIESRFAAVTPELVMETAREYLRASNRTILTVQQERPNDPPPPTLPPPPPARILPRNQQRLDNGMRATFVRAGAVPMASVRLVIRTGSSDVPAGQGWLDRFVHEYLREGTEEMDASTFADALAALGGRLTVDADEHTTVLRTEVLAEHAPEAIALLAAVARRPRFPEAEAERLRNDLHRNLDLALAQPQYVTFAAFRRARYGDHPYGRVIPDEAAFAGFDAAAARAFWEVRTGAQRALLLVGGVFDEAATIEAWRAAFEDWATGPTASSNPPSPASGRTLHLVDRPGAEQSTVYVGRSVPDPTHADYVATEVTNALLGGSFHSRITMNIREAKGYTYSPHAFISSRPRDAYWVEIADVTTAVTGAAIAEIFGEVERLRSEAPPPEELLGIQNYVAGAFVLRQATPGGILDHLEFLELHGLDEHYSAAYVDRVRAVTPDEVRRIAEQHLGTDGMTIAVAGDRSTIDAQLAAYGPASE